MSNPDISIQPELNNFGLRIFYDQGNGSPSRVFLALSGLIEALEFNSKILLDGIPAIDVEPSFIVENVEKNCITAWFRNVFRINNQTAKFDHNKASKFLNSNHTRVIRIGSFDNEQDINAEVDKFRNQIYNISEDDHPVEDFPVIVPPSRKDILESLGRYQSATTLLGNNDVAKYVASSGEEVSFDFPFEFTPGSIQKVLTRDVLENTQTVVLKVKKPDYLGASMWEFKWDKSISARVSDQDWLKRFKSRSVVLLPGDSIVAQMKTKTSYDIDGEVISTDYDVIKVLEERRPQSSDPSLFDLA
jgi:hypothetical protein